MKNYYFHYPDLLPAILATGNAIQIRQMGTLASHRRKGFAAAVLSQLEENAVKKFGAVIGFLQAREHAIPFYQSQGWEIIDEEYVIQGIGNHRSMMKYLD